MKLTDKEVCEKFAAWIKTYQWPNRSEKDMMKMFAQDRSDFRKVLALYKAGKWRECAEFAGHMDTGARDHIPNRIWEDIHS